MDFVQKIRGVIHALNTGNLKARIRAKMGEGEPNVTPRLRFNIQQLELGEFSMVQTLDAIFKCGKDEVEIAICGLLSKKTLCSSLLDREHFYNSEAYLKYYPNSNPY